MEEKNIMEAAETDYVLNRIGDFGRFQFRIIGFHAFVGIIAAWQLLSIGFVLHKVEFWCSPKELNLPLGQRIHWTSPMGPDNKTVDSCLMYDVDYETVTKEPINTDDKKTISCSRWDFSTSEFSDSLVAKFNLVCGNSFMLKVSELVSLMSKMCGALFSGILSDKFGRKKMIYTASLSFFLFGFFAPFSNSMVLFTILNGGVSAASTTLFTCGFVYCMELVGGKWSTFVSFYVEYCWAFVYLTLPLIILVHPQLSISLPILGFVAVIAIPSLVPESPKWLLVNGKLTEMEEILRRAEKTNKRKSEKFLAVPKGTETNCDSFNLLVLKMYSSMGVYPLMMCLLFFVNSLVYYGFIFNAEIGSVIGWSVEINMIFSAALEFLAYTVSIISFLFIGKRSSLSLFTTLGGIFFLFDAVVGSLTIKLVLAKLGKFCITASFGMVYQYAVELFPTESRNTGLGCCVLFSHLGTAIAVVGGPSLVSVNPYLVEIGFGVLSLLAGYLTLYLPDIENKAMQNTLEEWENCFKVCDPARKKEVNQQDPNSKQCQTCH